MRVAPPGREAQVGRMALPTSGRTLPLLRNRPYANPALNRVAIGAAGGCTRRHAVTASVTSRQCGRQWDPGHDEARAVTHFVRTASRRRGAPSGLAAERVEATVHHENQCKCHRVGNFIADSTNRVTDVSRTSISLGRLTQVRLRKRW